MKNNRYRLFIWASLATLLLIGIPSLFQNGPQIIGKSFIDTDDFKREMSIFYDSVGAFVLNPVDADDAKKGIEVTQDEIEEHRSQYGVLSDQISNIHDQYEGRVFEAKDAGNEVLEETLIKERDAKVADIQKNFESDEHVEEKIRAQKALAIDRYITENIGATAENFPIAYNFVDVETGKVFSKGNIDVPAAYKKQFNASEGLFKANSIYSENYDSYSSYNNYGDSARGFTMDYTSSEMTVDSMEGELSSIKNSVRTFEGVVVVPKTALKSSYLGGMVKDFNHLKYTSYVLWVLGFLSTVALFKVIRFKKEWVMGSNLSMRYDKLKVDVKAALLFLSLLISIELILSRVQSVFFYSNYYTGIWTDRIISFVSLAIAIAFIAFQLVNMIERWKNKGVLEQDIKESYSVKFIVALRGMFLNKKIGAQMFLLLIGFFLAGIGFVVMFFHPINIIIYLFCVLFFGLPILYIFARRAAYLNRIIIATEQMAAGRLHDEIEIEGKSPLAEHAKNLNNLREGVRSSMSEQAKSERLKTELITNVSHDLRTPLTSIITYTDLLKNKELSVEERMKYVDILDMKSQRLKTLIEDLFEVSKMASGNLKLNKQRVDLTQLLQQSLAEHSEEITELGLDFRVSLPESALVAYIDGKRWWRVLDNLIVNAIKYTLPGTRVYITLREVGNNAEFVVKNVTKYELGENTDELFERFKRADTSRHTEGSGLGLAIAQSIVDMHHGEMKIEVDGDLFKVSVSVPLTY